MAESIKAGTAGARLTRWPGLIEHYRRFLPVTDKTPVVTLNEGNTPLIESPALADRVARDCPDAAGAGVTQVAAVRS